MAIARYRPHNRNDVSPEVSCFPGWLFRLWLGGALLVLAAISLFGIATHYYGQYARAEAAAFAAQARTPSPEPFYQRAQYAADSIILVCIVAVIVTLNSRHPISLAALIVCIAILVYALTQVGTRL